MSAPPPAGPGTGPTRDPRPPARALPRALPRLLLACGLAAPAIFLGVLLVLGALQPGYSHAADAMSELGARDAAHPLAMNVLGFGLLGTLTVLFAAGLGATLRAPSGAVAAGGVALVGLGLLGVAALPCDPGCADLTPTGRWHDVAAAVPAAGAYPAVLAGSWHFMQRGARGMAAFSLACLLAGSIAGLAYLTEALPWEGALQRSALGPVLLWMAGTSAWLLLRADAARKRQRPPGTP